MKNFKDKFKYEQMIHIRMNLFYVLLWDCDEDPWAEPVNRPADPCDEPPEDPRDAFAIPLLVQEKQNELRQYMPDRSDVARVFYLAIPATIVVMT